MLIKTILLSAILIMPKFLEAQTSICVLDGGGSPQDRSCGISNVSDQLQSMYSGQASTTKITYLSGPGPSTDTASAGNCATALVGCDEKGKCGGSDVIGSDSWSYKEGRTVTSSPTIMATDSPSLRKQDQWVPGSASGFEQSCFFDSKNPPETKIKDCQFYSFNHGSPRGALFYDDNPNDRKSPVMTNDNLRSKADQCESFRYFTNSCFGGQLANIIYKDPSNPSQGVLPGRCGMSASPPGYPALGMSIVEPTSPKIDLSISRNDGHTQSSATARPTSPLYPAFQLMAQTSQNSNAGESMNLDSFYDDGMVKTTYFHPDEVVSNLKTGALGDSSLDLSGVNPYMTSDFYLAKTLGNSYIPEDDSSTLLPLGTESQRMAVFEKVLKQGQSWIETSQQCLLTSNNNIVAAEELVSDLGPVIDLLKGSLTSEEQQKLKAELLKEANKLTFLTKLTCLPSPPTIPFRHSSAIATSAPEGTVGFSLQACDLESLYQTFAKERAERLVDYDKLNATAEGLYGQMTKICKESLSNFYSPERNAPPIRIPCGDLRGIEQKIKNYLTSSRCDGASLVVSPDRPIDGSEIAGCAPEAAKLIEQRNAIMALRAQWVPAMDAVNKEGSKLQKFMDETTPFRRYEEAKFRFIQVAQLVEQGTPEQLRDYMTLRDCEGKPMAAPVK